MIRIMKIERKRKEKELAKFIKFWHSKDIEYKVEPKIHQDDFFNEEYVLSNILKDKYIKKNYSIVPFQLIDYVIGELEKRVFVPDEDTEFF